MSTNPTTPGGDILSKQLLDLLLQTGNSNIATFGNASNNAIIQLYDTNLPFAPKNYKYGLYGNDFPSSSSSNTFFITANQSNLTRIGIGSYIADTSMEIYGTDALLLPKGSTSERPNPKKGQVRYNTELDLFEGYGTGNSWVPFGGVKNRDQSAKIDAEFFAGSLDNNLRFTTSNIERMRILPTGNIGIGTTNPHVLVEFNSKDAILIPKGTSEDRPGEQNVQKGMIRFNTTTQQFEGYGAGDTWGSLGGVKSTDQTTYISAEQSAGTNDSNLRFFTGDYQHMIITNQGLVGIGTTTPNSKVHMVGDLIVTGTVEAGAYGSLYRVADTYASVPLSNLNPQTYTQTVLTNDPNPTNRILYMFETSGGRFLVNGCIPYRNKSSLVAFNTTNWASISLHRLDIIPNTNPVQYETFTSSTPALQIAPMSIQTDEREYATHNVNFFVQNIYPARYVISLSGKGHEIEFGGNVSDTNIFVIPIRGLGYEDSYDVRRAIQLSPIRFSSNIPSNTPLSTLEYTIDGNLIPTGSSNVGPDLTVHIDGYRNGQKLTGQSWNQINPPFPPTDTDFYWYLTNIVDLNQSKVISTKTTIGFSNVNTTGPLEFTIWPTVNSSNVFQTGYFYQNAVRLGKIRIDNVYGNIGISASNAETMPLEEYSLYVDGDSYTNGTIFASNLTILGEAVTLNTVTSNTEQMVITNAGTGPALTVTQTGPQPIADFYDDNGVRVIRIANGGALDVTGNIGIGTTTPLQRLHVHNPSPQLNTYIRNDGIEVNAIQSGQIVPQIFLTQSITNTTPNTGVSLVFNPSSDTSYTSSIQSAQTSIQNDTDLRFLVSSTASQSKEAMRIIGSANIGIGTTIPLHTLHIQDRSVHNRLSFLTTTGTFPNSLGYISNDDDLSIRTTNSTGYVTLYTNNTERSRVDPTGNIGIGTTNPRNSLHIQAQLTIGNQPHHNNDTAYYNSVRQWTGATFETADSYNTNIITINNPNTLQNGFMPNLVLYNEHGGDNTTTGITFASPEVQGSVAGKTSVAIGGIIAQKLTGTAGSWATGAMTLFTKNSSTRVDAIHIINDGNVGIGTTSQINFKLRVEGKTLINNDLLVTGDITGFYQLSDRRLKTNIQTIPSALDHLMNLRPVTFQWNQEVNQLNKRGVPDVGLIAQEVRPYFPLVTEENMQFPSSYHDLMGIQYPKLIPYLIRSIQELNEKIKQLESRLP